MGVGLAIESVEGASMSLEGEDYIQSCDDLSVAMFHIGDGITKYTLQEYFKDRTDLFVDEPRDTFDAPSSCQATDVQFCDTLDSISEDHPVTKSAPHSNGTSLFRHTGSVDLQRFCNSMRQS